uniref:Cytochrome b5 heme-binding domain-containing protein n=1 Tax=Arcella intermedia TaxID=1963864 RepID=A0A6B2L214_9EUKA
MEEHPGGKAILLKHAGKDVSQLFHKYHGPHVLADHQRLLVRSLSGAERKEVEERSPMLYESAGWSLGFPSPYYKESHHKLRECVRSWVHDKISPLLPLCEKRQFPFKEIIKESASAGLLAATSIIPFPSQYLQHPQIMGGAVPPEDFDYFHQVIIWDELARSGSYGAGVGWFSGQCIGLPPVIAYGQGDFFHQTLIPSVLSGDKVICLAITEPGSGSDIRSTSCSAVYSSDRREFLLNGEKKWITNGIYADYFVTAVKIYESEEERRKNVNGRLSVVVVPRGEGVVTREMECSGLHGTGTTFVSFSDVRVPVEYLLGKAGDGFNILTRNFNHERLFVIVVGLSLARVCFREAFCHAQKREVFGKSLMENGVIRKKFGMMARELETTWAWVEQVTFLMDQLRVLKANGGGSKVESLEERLGSRVALLKGHTTKVLEFCSREAAQVMGGLGFTKGGIGDKVERAWRDARGFSVFAGSEEVMFDMAVRKAQRDYQKENL